MLEKIRCRLNRFSSTVYARTALAILLVAATATAIALLSGRVNTIVIDDGNKTYKMHTISGNIKGVVSTLSLKSENYKILKVSKTGSETQVKIVYTFPVHITMGSETKTIYTAEDTVAGILESAGYTPDEYDYAEPSLDTVVTKSCYIDYVNVDYSTETYVEEIPFEMKTVFSPSYATGTTTLSGGATGSKNVTSACTYVNGVLTEATVLSETVISKPVSGTKIIGTGNAVSGTAVTTSNNVSCVSTLKPNGTISLDENGNPLNYTKKITARATAYTYTGHRCSTGMAPQPGCVAVNPKYIPYGTKMYIKTLDGRYIYGYAVAADTGGFIKKYPTGVDLFFPNNAACSAFGVRTVEIYILN